MTGSRALRVVFSFYGVAAIGLTAMAAGAGWLLVSEWGGEMRVAEPENPGAIQLGEPGFEPQVIGPGQPPITAVPARPVAAARGEVADDELVLGVVVGGEARAYPINMLNGPTREVFNDTLGGRAIAATW